VNAEVLKAFAALLQAAPTGQVLRIVEMALELSLIIARDMPPEMRTANWAEVMKVQQFWRDLFDKLTPNT
jgi:hypothetical protein